MTGAPHVRPFFANPFKTELFTLWSIIQAAGWPIWPLILCSVLALALIAERFVALRTAKVAPSKLVDEAITASRNGVPSPDVVTQLEQHSMLGEVLASGLRLLNTNNKASDEVIRSTLEASGRRASAQMERFLPALATIASAAPMLGLLGTVVGMIMIFGAQPDTGASVNGNPGELAHGISVALYNTAFGLIVAIPALVAWRYFRAKVDGHLLTMELAATRFERHLIALRDGGSAA